MGGGRTGKVKHRRGMGRRRSNFAKCTALHALAYKQSKERCKMQRHAGACLHVVRAQTGRVHLLYDVHINVVHSPPSLCVLQPRW